jgi:hypothetical protein
MTPIIRSSFPALPEATNREDYNTRLAMYQRIQLAVLVLLAAAFGLAVLADGPFRG